MTDPSSKEFLDALRVSEIGAQIAQEIDQNRYAARKALADELEQLHRAVEKSFPKLSAAAEKTLADLRAAETALQAARIKHGQAVGAKTSASLAYTARRNGLEAELTATASPLLSEFVIRMREEAKRTRKALTTTVRTETNFVTGRKNDIVASNSARIRARLAAISAAVEAAQEAMLLADQSGVPDLLFRLEAELPPVEVL
jgi:hypothetical protein